MQTVTAAGKPLGCFSGHVARIQSVAGARLAFELRPELAYLQPLCNTLPEAANAHVKWNTGSSWLGPVGMRSP